MSTINDICCTYGSVAMLATVGRDRQFALCHSCSNCFGTVHDFAARFAEERDPGTHIREANRFLTAANAGDAR